jgi:hypothetical protein
MPALSGARHISRAGVVCAAGVAGGSTTITTPKFRLAEIGAMRLSRRDALAALGALGLGGGAVAGGRVVGELAARGPPVADDPGSPPVDGADDGAIDGGVLAVLVACAEVVYPSDVTGHEQFVATYVGGRARSDAAHRAGLVETTAELDAVARDWHDEPFADLPGERRDRLLRDLAVHVADPDPDGSISARIRFYVVNDLLYALYTSPTGGRLVGTENPTGYPGGIESYRRGPEGVDDG